MRGRGAIVAAVCAAFFIAVVPGAGAVPQSSVSGSGTGHFAETGGPFSLSVNGRGEGPLAQGRASGSGVYVDYFEVSGPITCIRVEGNLASVKDRFTSASGPGTPPQNGGVQVYIEDNGKAKGGVPGVCTGPRLKPAWTPVESGDFSVFDAG